MATRIFKNGNLYIFQDDDNLERINTLNVGETTYDVSGTRHYFKQIRGQRLHVVYSFGFCLRPLGMIAPSSFSDPVGFPEGVHPESLPQDGGIHG